MCSACYLRDSRMKRRFQFCITLLGLSHLFLALPLLTSQLLPPVPVEMGTAPLAPPITAQKKPATTTTTTSPSQMLLSPDLGEPLTITAKNQEQSGKVVTLTGDVVIEFRDMTFKADEAVYNRESGEITATGHIVI